MLRPFRSALGYWLLDTEPPVGPVSRDGKIYAYGPYPEKAPGPEDRTHDQWELVDPRDIKDLAPVELRQVPSFRVRRHMERVMRAYREHLAPWLYPDLNLAPNPYVKARQQEATEMTYQRDPWIHRLARLTVRFMAEAMISGIAREASFRTGRAVDRAFRSLRRAPRITPTYSRPRIIRRPFRPKK